MAAVYKDAELTLKITFMLEILVEVRARLNSYLRLQVFL